MMCGVYMSGHVCGMKLRRDVSDVSDGFRAEHVVDLLASNGGYQT